jgi:sulfate adenylyltransferase subunit 1 (EFTu-like GTPase family)
MLVKTAGVKHLVILVNKMDDPTVNWDVKRYAPTFFCWYLASEAFIVELEL